MFEKSTEYIFSTISSTIKYRQKEMKMKRRDLLSDESLVSHIVNNHRTSKHPNLMSNENADDISKKLKFNSTKKMLWGSINWKGLFDTALHEIYLYHGTSDTMNGLHDLLFDVLINNVNFANMYAAISYDIYPLDGKDKQVRDKAIQEFLLRAEALNGESLQKTLEHQFHQQFDEDKLIKFTVKFPEFLLSFFKNVLCNLTPAKNATGRLAYYLSINAYEAAEMESNAWYYREKQGEEYAKIIAELNKAINAMQKLHTHEMSLDFIQQTRKSI